MEENLSDEEIKKIEATIDKKTDNMELLEIANAIAKTWYDNHCNIAPIVQKQQLRDDIIKCFFEWQPKNKAISIDTTATVAKEKALTKYIYEKHTQEECVGFIDGYKQAMEEYLRHSLRDKFIAFKKYWNKLSPIKVNIEESDIDNFLKSEEK